MLNKFKEKLGKFEINPSKFYKIGVWCFGIIAIVNTFIFINNLTSIDLADLNIFMLISSGASLVFNYALLGFFYYLKGTLPPDNLEKGSLADMENMIIGGKKK